VLAEEGVKTAAWQRPLPGSRQRAIA
jgi:hypothetical protein